MSARRRIVDAHHHLWDLDACHYPWLMQKGVVRFFGDPAPIRRNYLADELRSNASNYDLAASVHIQVGVADGDEVKESQWLTTTAKQCELPSAIVAFCDLSADNASDVLTQQAAFDRVRGIRQIVGRSAEEDVQSGSGGLLADAQWIRNLRLLREMNLSFDLQLIPQQANRIAAILQDLPGLRVALCHCGSPWDQSASGLRSWREGLSSLAELPDVFCKISGLSMFNHNWTIADVRPIIEACIDVFGPERCMFGSNFPVDKLHKTYDEIWQSYELVASQYSEAEQRRLFCATAESFYGLSDSSLSQ
jgi:predicted TIM-barrel fold metal-dependent hydrolase